jgi:YebC/PmpR family DNA-binding regulatory protein
MAGHNKWSKVKHTKGAADAKRAKIFSRMAKEITIAAKTAGGDPDANPRLRTAIATARAQNMPNDKIDKAIKRGTGEGGEGAIEEYIYEGYGPGGVAILIEAASDNKNRTTADLRLIFTKNNGNLASSGAVAYMFKRAGQIMVPKSAVDEDRLLDLVLEAGGEELTGDDEAFTVTTAPDQLYAVGEALKAGGVEPESQNLVFVAETASPVADAKTAQQVIRLCDLIEENDDVQNVFSNCDIPDEMLAELSAN